MKPSPRKIARVLFDEFHSESWSISAERALEMEPGRAANSSYHSAANLLAERDYVAARHLGRPLDDLALSEAEVLVFPHPCDARWERTTSAHSPALSPTEIETVQAFVRRGGGLLVITENEHAKYGDNLNELLAPSGLRIENGTAFDRSACVHENAEWVFASPVAETPLAHRVERACFYRAGWCTAAGGASLAWQTSAQAFPPQAGLIGLGAIGAGRVAVVTDSVLFGDERIGEFDHRQLWLNLISWLAAPAIAGRLREISTEPRPAVANDGWDDLKAAVTSLRALQRADGSVAEESHMAARELVEKVLPALAVLRGRFPHQAEYLAALPEDFEAWRAAHFAKPDFGRSLAAFHPERDRRDGREHLVLFPMYTPNASSDTRFEALIMRTPWPDWLEDLERTAYRNAKFAPGHLVDFTPGYASDCAVLFPETVSAGGRAPNHFATIFCDREARRLRDCTRRAAKAVQLLLFPELELWLGAPPLIEDTMALWDLIHDASHSVGELPFDPFMIRQRAPFWMYGLEELRVDLRSFEEASRLAVEGFPFARYVTWAILLDRVFRFPITGPRVRNYDALGGQLLFAYLHQHDILLWRDNRLAIRWDALAEGFRGLRAELTALYKLGAECSKLTFWLAGHELVSRYLRPNVASQWKEGARVINDERDPKRWIGLVQEDEFPLGSFHLNLQRKLAVGPS